MNPSPTDGLRGLHLPVEPGWWPPGPGWWLVAIIVISLIAVVFVSLKRRRESLRWQREAMSEWQEIKGIGVSDAARRVEVIQACSRLLRRTALALRPRLDVAGLTGDRWLQQLDSLGQTRAFSAGVGRLLVDAPYQPEIPEQREVAQLLELTRSTIRRAQIPGNGKGRDDD